MSQQNPPRVRPVIRVFVSSTFSDLKHERDVLQEHVFPKLEQFCVKSGFQFQAIDLRWGVSSEAGLDHRTMRICFDELQRAQEISPKPNFLILLGTRYGWRPLPEEISVDEFLELELAASRISAAEKPAGEVLSAWYRKDDNAIPPVYILQSRRQPLPDGKDYVLEEHWNYVQTILWEIINRAYPPEQLQKRFDATMEADGAPPTIVRFQASATEQEIWHGALRVSNARDHVLAFVRQIENIGEFAEPERIKEFVDLKRSGNAVKVDEVLWDEQRRLKEMLKPRLGEKNVFSSSVRLVPTQDIQGNPSFDVATDHLAQLCTDVEDRLADIIREQIDEYWNKSALASTERATRELKIEQDEHQRFASERSGTESFVGRKKGLERIRKYLRNDSRFPLVVHGASGCGKTALLGRASEELSESDNSRFKPGVIVRFIGVTPHSSDIVGYFRDQMTEEERQRQSPEVVMKELMKSPFFGPSLCNTRRLQWTEGGRAVPSTGWLKVHNHFIYYVDKSGEKGVLPGRFWSCDDGATRFEGQNGDGRKTWIELQNVC